MDRRKGILKVLNMIANDAEMSQSLERMYRSLAARSREVYAGNPQQLALLAEGLQEEIERLQEQIVDSAGRTKLLELFTHT